MLIFTSIAARLWDFRYEAMSSIMSGSNMIHYHGGPITPLTAAFRLWRARHAMISYAHPSQIDVAAAICQSFALDNGAFPAWTQGTPITDWSGFYDWCQIWIDHPACDFALIPDVIDGEEADNDALIREWPHGSKGVPVWHLHESLDKLNRLSHEWPRIALGSSGQYSDVGSSLWWARMGAAMNLVQGDNEFPRTKLHGCRMLAPRIFTRLPLSSGDSTNIARNIGLDASWAGPYLPKSRETRAIVLAERIEEHNAAPIWRELTQGNIDWVVQSLGNVE